MKRRLLSLIAASLFAAVPAFSQVEVFEGSLKDQLKLAKQSKKEALVMVSTTWCGPCRGFVKNMIPNKELGEYINSRYVFSHYDVDKADPDNLVKTYGVGAFPTFLFLDQNGKEIGRALGARTTVEEVKELFEAAHESVLPKLRKEFAKNPAEKAEEYIGALRQEYRSKEIQDALDKLCGVMDPADVISKFTRDIRFESVDEYSRPLAQAISKSDALFSKYGSMLERPITSMANDVMNHLGSNDAKELASLKSAISTYGKYAAKYPRFVSENGDAVIKGDVPALLDQIKRADAYGPQPRLTALFAIMRKTKADKTIDKYKAQMKSVLESIDGEEKADRNFMKNLWKYVE